MRSAYTPVILLFYLLLCLSAGFFLSEAPLLWMSLFIPAPFLYVSAVLRRRNILSTLFLFPESCLLLWFFFYYCPQAGSGFLYCSAGLLWLIPYLFLQGSSGGNKPLYQTLFSLFLMACFPLVIYRLLRGEGPVYPLVLFQVFVNGLLFTASRKRRTGLMFLLSGTALFLYALFAVSGILITPVSAWFAWFELVAGGGGGGLISFIFVMLLALFMILPAAMVYFSSFLSSVTVCSFILLFFCSLILQNNGLIILLVSGITLWLFVTAFGRSVIPGSYWSPLVLVLLAAGMALLAGSVKSKPYADIIDSHIFPRLRALVIEINDDFPLLYALPGYGYSIDGSVLGGRPVLSERPVFQLSLSESLRRKPALYLRSQVLEQYTGRGWQSGQKEGANDSASKTAERPGDSTFAAKIEILLDFYSLIPHLLTHPLPSLDPQSYVELPLDSGYQMNRALYRNQSFVLYESDALISNNADDSFLYVPENGMESLKVLEQRLSLGGRLKGRPFLEVLEKYFSENFIYSLDTDVNPPGSDAVSWFLTESRKGYCSHFASAYVLLCRLNGTPARYVSGFLVTNPERERSITVSGYSAHAWAEVFLQDEGWQTREATPPMNSEWGDYYISNYYAGSATDDYTREQLVQLQLAGAAGTGDPPSEKEDLLSELSPVFFIIPVLLFVSVPLVILILRIRNPKRRLKLYMGLISFRYHLPDPASGWFLWMKKLEEKQPASSVSEFHRELLEVAYGGRPVRKRLLYTARSLLLSRKKGL